MEIDIPDLLKWMRGISENFQDQTGRKWLISEQLEKIGEEICELFELIFPEDVYPPGYPEAFPGEWNKAILKKTGKNREKVLEEFWDVIMAWFTLAHVMGFSDRDILTGLERVMKKLNHRSETNHYRRPGK